MTKMRGDIPTIRQQSGPDMVTVLVGQQQREFHLNRKLLCSTSSFFRAHLESSSSSSSTQNGPSSSSSSSSTSSDIDQEDEEEETMWLPAESPDMFALFVLWLHHRRSFASLIDRAIPFSVPSDSPQIQSLRWSLARLHIFASIISLPALQDIAMDALQDLYLRCDLDVSPRFVAYLYQECDASHAVRLRKWAVAMLAWSLACCNMTPLSSSPLTHEQGGGEVSGTSSDKNNNIHALWDKIFAAYPALAEDYRIHLSKMAQSKADIRIKNPQLRLPMNKLRSGERFFGFRQCSFHSHRASVGEGLCPHLDFFEQHRNNHCGSVVPPPGLPPRIRTPGAVERQRQRQKYEKRINEAEEEEEEEEEVMEDIISPVGEEGRRVDVSGISFLDLS
ncbi:hypothetical protein QBC47DRAFT_413965 [Echria macrotheca]|uniref:BTB domain-containing protein n=1 Tax=Echria macrotheca TaxID=438768 RepID=A0AAJ0BDH1_9PEZI|nr:hypothetical protein QBC47DRAFT_413965 [Echria macrotheca]